MAEVIRGSRDRVLREEYSPSEDELWERALKAVGYGRLGAADVSERHDDYLLEAYSE